MTRVMWSPTEEQIAASQLIRFRDMVNRQYDVSLTTYPEIYQWSIDNPDLFWAAVWDFAGIIHSRPYSRVMDGDGMTGTKWFPGARLNFAENLLRYRDDRVALAFNSEGGASQELTYAQLYNQVSRAARGLKALGVGVGDRVGGFVPNFPQTVIAMLAATSLGAIWSSCSPDFGIQSVLDRFAQIEPKVLFTADGYFYNGKSHDSLARAAGVAEAIPSILKTVVIPYLDDNPSLDGLPGRAELWDDFLGDDQAPEPDFVQLPFDHPIYIVYSSGTSGAPKCIVHGAGAALLQITKEHRLHADITRDDRFFYFTTCGWVMWNWLHAGLAAGATLIEYDGSPFYPDVQAMWRMAEKEKISVFGTSARFIAYCQHHGIKPGEEFDLSNLRLILSTASVLTPENFDYIQENIRADIPVCSMSGGTDILSGFATGCPIMPVLRGELQCRGLGMKVQAYDDRGEPVIDREGELVCTAPFPATPLYFWNDPDGAKYHAAYFDHYPGVWTHGDFIRVTGSGGVIVYGRSDATLNPGGVRIGTAEIYRQVDKLPQIEESLAVGQKWDNDVRMILFVKLVPGEELTDRLRRDIRTILKENASPRHIPAKIIAVADIPVTLSGKKVEQTVRNLIHGKPAENRDALANPGALDLYINLPELQE